ncbi:MAG: hypothetical protein WC346_03900 [Methanogenium sp.]|jgi:hypothetical protein
MSINLGIYSGFLVVLVLMIAISISTPLNRGTMLKIHSDLDGNLSWMRVASSLLFLFALMLLLCEKITDQPISVNLILSFIGTAFGAKFLQSGINKGK